MTRRTLLSATPLAGAAAALAGVEQAPLRGGGSPPTTDFPSQEREVVKELVARSHFDLQRVKELVEARPALAKAAWDWGFGDWETALGAASHMGRRDIAEVLMANGARPDLFTAAMMGWTDVVRAAVTASPGIQGIAGPHGITLLAHARAGGARAAALAAYLEELGGADPRSQVGELQDTQRTAYLGTYVFGPGGDDRLIVDLSGRGEIAVRRGDRERRALVYLGRHAFHPVGAAAVRLTFELDEGHAVALHVADGALKVRAVRTV